MNTNERPKKSQFEALGECIICICNMYARAKLIGDIKLLEMLDMIFNVEEWDSILDVYIEFPYVNPFPTAYYVYLFSII